MDADLHARRDALRADCSRCAALCCVVPMFSRSSEFAIDKAAGTPCPNLASDLRCGIHAQLRDRGFAGCTSYDCFGAGQHVTQVTFGGHDWRSSPEAGELMGEVFPVMRHLHELMRHVAEASTFERAVGLRATLAQDWAELEADIAQPADALVRLDLAAIHARVNSHLVHASGLERADEPAAGVDLRGADLVGVDLRARGLRGASLRGARLVGADLRGVDLGRADVAGADLRGADVRGAVLSGVVYLVQPQLDSARGDAETSLPGSFGRPAHWGV
jgi:uncharacterized protein YjbI with pentapeptide repeats